jgi:hypothetical protein
MMNVLGRSRHAARSNFSVAHLEFTAADLDRLDQLEELTAHYQTRSRLQNLNAVAYMDYSEGENILPTLELLITLFPFAVAAAVLIGAIAPILILLRLAKEAAVLRAIGTTKVRSRAMLGLEQLILCVLGIMLAIAGLLVLNNEEFAKSAGVVFLCTALYFVAYAIAVITTTVQITRRKVLDLLQVRE